MRAEYDFASGVRGKHHHAMQAGYTITIRKADGTTVVRDVMPKGNAVLLEPDVQLHFPDSESVNRALRHLVQRHQWSRLTGQQLGRYAEYLVKMEFTLCGCDVYSAEVDDKGIDFVVRTEGGQYYDVQVKSARDCNYIYAKKTKLPLRGNLLVAVVLFSDNEAPILYLIPSTVWRTPNSLFVSRDYAGKKTEPEWGLNLTKRNLHLLDTFSFEKVVGDLLSQETDDSRKG